MREVKNVFSDEIEVPEVVIQKANDAFASIQTEGTEIMSTKKKDRKKKWFRNQAVAAACICVLAAGGITVAASAVHHIWSRGMQGKLQATEEQQQLLVDQGIAEVLPEDENYESLAVTDGAVTVTPNTVVIADQVAYMSFSVTGYDLEEGKEPCFEFVDVYLGDDPEEEGSEINMSASFYDEVVTDETGSTQIRYADEDGTLEYVITVMVSDPEQSLLGQTIHVDLQNLGTVYKTDFTGTLDGTWNFALDLPNVSAAKHIPVAAKIEGSAMVLDTIDLSPASVKLNYSVNGEPRIDNDENGVPDFCGVVLKDGTRYPYMSDGGMNGYDETEEHAYVISAFDRVIDPEQVEAILVRLESGDDMVEIPVIQ